MPYGIKGRLAVQLQSVRKGTACWLQEIAGTDGHHVRLIGLSTARKMVSFGCAISQVGYFEYCFFAADLHPRLVFASKAEAQRCAGDLTSRAASGGLATPRFGDVRFLTEPDWPPFA